jgi:hypothetical protein
MYNKLLSHLNKHPSKFNMNYFQHFTYAIKLSAKLAYASCCLIIHAVYPNFFENTATDIIKEIYNERHK